MDIVSYVHRTPDTDWKQFEVFWATLAAAISLPALMFRSAAKASANFSASCRASKVATGNAVGSTPLLTELPLLCLHVPKEFRLC